MKHILTIIQFTMMMLLKDRKSIFILLLMPFILIAVLGTSLAGMMSGGDFQFERARLAIVDEDQTLASRLLIDNGFKNQEIQQLIATEEHPRQEAESLFANKKVDGILYIHKGYEYNFIYGIKDDLLVKMNPINSIQTDIIKQVLTQYHIMGKMVVDAVNQGRSIYNFPSVDRFLTNQTIQLEVKKVGEEETTIDSFQYYTVGMGVMYALFTMFTGVSFVMYEKKQYTLNRIRLMPFPIGFYYIGKALSFMMITILQLIVLFVSSHLVFGVGFGAYPFYLFLMFIAYSAATSGLMILLLGWIKDNSTINVFFSIGVPIIAALGGSMVPIGVFPWFIEPISKLLPNRWAMDGLFNIMMGRLDAGMNAILTLFAFALITSILGIFQLRRGEEKRS